MTFLPAQMTEAESQRVEALKGDARVTLIIGDVVAVLQEDGTIDLDGLKVVLADESNAHLQVGPDELLAMLNEPEHVSFDGVAADAFGVLAADWEERSPMLAMRALRFATRSEAHTLQVKIAGGSTGWMNESFFCSGSYRFGPFQAPAAKHSEYEFYVVWHQMRPGSKELERWFAPAFVSHVLRLYIARAINATCLAMTWAACYYGQAGRLPPCPAKDDPEVIAFRQSGAFVQARDLAHIELASVFLAPSQQVAFDGPEYTLLRSMTLMSALLLNPALSRLPDALRRGVWADGHGVGLLGVMLALAFCSVDGCEIAVDNVAAVSSNAAACNVSVSCRALDAFSAEARDAAASFPVVVMDPLWAPGTGPGPHFRYAERSLHELARSRAQRSEYVYVRGPFSTDKPSRPRYGPWNSAVELAEFYSAGGIEASFL